MGSAITAVLQRRLAPAPPHDAQLIALTLHALDEGAKGLMLKIRVRACQKMACHGILDGYYLIIYIYIAVYTYHVYV
jgi:hypothetical protein